MFARFGRIHIIHIKSNKIRAFVKILRLLI
jgi:hypothetical protein